MPLKKISEWPGWGRWAAIFGCIGGITMLLNAAMAFAGFQLPVNAWKEDVVIAQKQSYAEIRRVEQESKVDIVENQIYAVESAIKMTWLNENMQQSVIDNLQSKLRNHKIKKYEIENHPDPNHRKVPAFLLEEIMELETEIANQQADLDEVRSERISLEKELRTLKKRLKEGIMIPNKIPSVELPVSDEMLEPFK